MLPASVDYTDRDFESLRARLIALVKSVFPDGSDFDVASFGNVLLELFAFVGDTLTFYQDNLARESRLVTATQRRSVIALAKMLGYRLKGARAATASVTFELAVPPAASVTIPAGTVVRTKEVTEPIRFQTLAPIVFTAGLTPPRIVATVEHSKTRSQLFDARVAFGLRLVTRAPRHHLRAELRVRRQHPRVARQVEARDDRSHRWVYNLELFDVLHEGRSRPLVDVASLRHEPGLVDVWELTWEEFCFRSPPLVLEEKFRGAAPHPELCAWVPMQPACIDWVADEFERLDPAADTGNGPILFFPARPDLVSAPLFRMPRHEPCVFFWGLLRRAEPATAERIASQFADNEVLYARALERGAVRYVPDTTPDDDRFWAAHFGPLWETILELKRRYDPDAILASSFGGAASRASVAVRG